MNIILTNIYLFILAAVLAVLEIQIEGQHGWAKNLPTWRPKGHEWYAKAYVKIMSGKEMTGYHVTMFSLVFLIFGLPYVFGLPFNLEDILKTISFYFLFVALWDFLWFVLNPHYPLSRFKKEHLSFHHKQWLWGIPIDYYFALIISLLVLLPLMLKSQVFVGWWLINVSLFGLQTFLIIIFSLYVLKIDKWHKHTYS